MLICCSRIYLGVHYLSDVMVGALVGIMTGGLCWFVVNKYFLKEVK
jgi:membrane-associated phospholipid phosphatase